MEHVKHSKSASLGGRGKIAMQTLCAAFLALPAFANAADAPVHDRRPYFSDGEITTDDPVRVPRRPSDAPLEEIILKGGRVFDAVGKSAKAATVIVKGNKIAALLPPDASGWAADARVIDVSGKTVMPGLIDMHVHITYPDRDTPIDEQASEGSGVLRGQRNLRYFIESGFTSVRDLNGVSDAPYLLSRWSAANAIPAPRVFTAGHIITGTGGHATERPITPNHGPEYAREADGVDAWRSEVRKAFKAGASLIKVASHFSQVEINTAVEEAHSLGLKVTCDCETIYIDRAIEAGVDVIEHPLPRSNAAISKMAKKGVASIPTVQVYQGVIDRSGGYFGSTSRRFTMTSQGNFDVFKKMKAAGVVMGVGTDTIGEANKHIPNNYIAELKWFVKVGYSIPEALKAATLVNAKLLDMDDKLGSVEAGKLADLIVIDGKPDENLDDLANVDLVIKDGVVVVQSGMVVTPRHVALPLVKPSSPEGVR